MFNQYFSSVFTKEDLSSMPTTSSRVNPALEISDIEITEEMVRKKLATVRQDKAGRVNDILPRLLANIQNEISYPLWKLFCKSMSLRVQYQKTGDVLMWRLFSRKGIK